MPGKDLQGPKKVRIASRLARGVLALMALALAFALGRSSRPQQEEIRTAVQTPATREAAALEKELVSLEARMHVGLSWAAHNSELARRHGQVSAIACTGAVDHAKEVERLAQRAARRANRQAARIKAEDTDDAGKSDETPPAEQGRSAAKGHRSG